MTATAFATFTILVVDDHAGTRRPLARLLRGQGYETLCVANGDEAMETLQFTRPHLVLLDLAMPVMGGLEFLTVLRRDRQWSGLPVVVLTASGPGDDASREALRLGARECLAKGGHTPDELFASIRRHLAA